MNINQFKTVATRTAHRGALLAKKYSPEILTGIGIAGGVTAGVMAARATLKLEPVMERAHEGLATVREKRSDEGYSDDQEYAKDLAYVYTISAVDVIRLYGPSVTLAGASIVCIIGAHGIMKKRNAALVVAYNALEKSFSHYRERVVEEIGEDRERDIRAGLRKEEIEDENGKKKTVTTIDDSAHSPYARFFDETNPQWSENREYNLLFLTGNQAMANDKLRAQGHLFLNEVYDMLGIERSKAGAVVGWVYDDEGASDNFVDFNIFNVAEDVKRNFVNGFEPGILLDFNVDGVIYDKIGRG